MYDCTLGKATYTHGILWQTFRRDTRQSQGEGAGDLLRLLSLLWCFILRTHIWLVLLHFEGKEEDVVLTVGYNRSYLLKK